MHEDNLQRNLAVQDLPGLKAHEYYIARAKSLINGTNIVTIFPYSCSERRFLRIAANAEEKIKKQLNILENVLVVDKSIEKVLSGLTEGREIRSMGRRAAVENVRKLEEKPVVDK